VYQCWMVLQFLYSLLFKVFENFQNQPIPSLRLFRKFTIKYLSISIYFFWKWWKNYQRASGSEHILVTKKFSCKNYARNKPPKCNISLNIFHMNPLNPLEANRWTITISFSRIPNNLNFDDIPPIFTQSQLLQIPKAKSFYLYASIPTTWTSNGLHSNLSLGFYTSILQLHF
jgi:hypothetical protein